MERVVYGRTERFNTNHGNIAVTINWDVNNQPFEVLVFGGSTGDCNAAARVAIVNLANLLLSHRVDIAELIHHLKGINCCARDEHDALSVPDAIGKAIENARGEVIVNCEGCDNPYHNH